MKKTFLILAGLILIVSAGYLFLNNFSYDKEDLTRKKESVRSDLDSREIDEETSDNLLALIQDAKLSEFDDIYYFIQEFCFQKYGLEDNEECTVLFLKLKERGDKLKDDILKSINSSDPDLVKKLSDLQDLLRVQRTSSGKDKYFSKENVEFVNRETKKIIKKALLKDIEEGTVSDLYDWLNLILVNLPASCDTKYFKEKSKTSSDFGLFYWEEICDLPGLVRREIKRRLLEEMSTVDLCNVSSEEKERIKSFVGDCEKNIADELICEEVEKAEFLSLYNFLVEELDTDLEKVSCDAGIPKECTSFLNDTCELFTCLEPNCFCDEILFRTGLEIENKLDAESALVSFFDEEGLAYEEIEVLEFNPWFYSVSVRGENFVISSKGVIFKAFCGV